MAGLGLNKVLLIGNLTKDPELRPLPNGTPKAELRLATSRTYTHNGEKREDTCFIDVVAWSRTAENCQQYLKKGSKIFVEGRLDYQEWEKDGQKRSRHQVVADRVQFMDMRPSGEKGGPDGNGAEGDDSRWRGERRAAPQAKAPAVNGNGSYSSNGPSNGSTRSAEAAPPPRAAGMGEAMGINDEDIPF